MASYRAALDQGAQWIELDIRECADGTLVCIHDPTFQHDDIRSLPYGDLVNRSDASTAPPRLQEVLETMGGRIQLDLEIKEAGYEEKVVRLAQTFLAHDQYVITSFHDEVIRTVKDLDNRIRAGLILGVKHPKPWLFVRWSELFPSHRLTSCRADFVTPHFRLLKFGFLRRMQRGGWPVWVWTVNDERRIQSLLRETAVECIITDITQIALHLQSKETT